ncbi:GyrI-like domain-containing protein [Microbacterium gorillae]|uniref:GyrI-like domain-containing protein n=1 Tax=Microbacterium gorillae TaxID=1231063 RepID=UPI000694AB92|nr:GyrI-like domain-containing protein [Microbacterium gorillae]
MLAQRRLVLAPPPAPPAVAVYRGDVQATFDLELGYPAASAPTNAVPSPAGVITTSAFPAGPAAVTSHVGSYEGLGAAWATLVAAAEGTPTGISIEAYVSDPRTTPEEQLRTDLVLPVR